MGFALSGKATRPKPSEGAAGRVHANAGTWVSRVSQPSKKVRPQIAGRGGRGVEGWGNRCTKNPGLPFASKHPWLNPCHDSSRLDLLWARLRLQLQATLALDLPRALNPAAQRPPKCRQLGPACRPILCSRPQIMSSSCTHLFFPCNVGEFGIALAWIPS
jgi:hypothetical protein